MSNATTQPPADVREQIKAVIREGVRYMAKADGAYLYEPSVDETADRILAILRTPRGEGDVKPLAWRVEYRGRTGGEWEYLNTYDLVEVAKEKVERMRRGGVRLEYRIVPLYAAAFRSEAQGEEDGGEFCDLCGEKFNPSEFGTVIGPLGEDDGVPRWYRCPRCARAYDAGYQQGQRDPRGDENADPTTPHSDAQGEDRWEDLIFGTLIEAYNEAQRAARRGEGGGE